MKNVEKHINEIVSKVLSEQVALKAEEIMSMANEELHGGQKKLDKNKNGKLDSDDFKMLRKDKKEKPRTPAGFEHGEIVSGDVDEDEVDSQWMADATNEALGVRINDFLEGVATPLYIKVDDDSIAPEIKSGDMVCMEQTTKLSDGIYVFNMEGRSVLRRVKVNTIKKSVTLEGNDVPPLEIAMSNAGILHIAGRVAFVLHKV
jgi:hypothetical protein